MSLNKKEISHILERALKHFVAFDKSLEIFFITHKTGERLVRLKEFQKQHGEHAYSPHLTKILDSWTQSKANDHNSEFIGYAEYPTSSLGGWVQKKHSIAALSLNLDSYVNLNEFELDLYRLCWNICRIKCEETDGASSQTKSRIVIPKPKGFGQLVFNLKSDIFSALTMSYIHQKNYIEELAQIRALTTLYPQKKTLPENRPFLIAIDQTKRIFDDLLSKKKVFSSFMEEAWKCSETIDKILAPEKLKLWYRFAKASQDMAWRNFSPEIILSAAIDRNEDIEIRKLGMLVSKITDIHPADFIESRGFYNPYMTNAENEEAHINLLQDLFDSVLTRCIFENSAEPFYEMAAKQNSTLKDGRFMGWCAHALQEAGDAFDSASITGMSNIQASRQAFAEHTKRTPWKLIRGFGEKILQIRRIGQGVNVKDLMQILSYETEYAMIRQSLIRSIDENHLDPENTPSSEEESTYAINVEFSALPNQNVAVRGNA